MNHCIKDYCEIYFIEPLDAFACLYCNQWMSEMCKGEGCDICPTRPKIPYEWFKNR
ncbi:hypothetical protein [Parageobacillus galactosidasius]|uniref:hypothetical protein n=1 Tax=Parageobacillus galactosidasius TaxID=883812 RepID=UPI001469D2F8|nr:hypothetical protein [Parageobacillus galactosidasius]